MLFYNHKHEFIGIDDDGLKLLNYATLEDLLGVCSDVADLFANEPGYIHNFKSFGWIDFILHADSDARTAIVHANGRTFSCTLSIHTLYLCAEPASNGYMVDMTHIQSISGEEIKPHTITPKLQPEIKPLPTEPLIPSAPAHDILPDYAHITPTALSEPGTLDVPTYKETVNEVLEEPVEDFYEKFTLPLSDAELNEETPKVEAPVLKERAERPMLGDTRYSNAEKEFLQHLKVDSSYRFDPNIAAHELGLPVDLILEFIGDFIQQAYEFKSELFEAVLKGDSNNIKILSHKLKGVAANLRIEDAFETLSIINTSSDLIEVEANLKYFYTIISKLEGKEPEEQNEAPLFSETDTLKTKVTPLSPSVEEDDIYEFLLKEDQLPVSDNTPTVMSIEETKPLEIPVVEVSVEKLLYDKNFISGQLGIEHDFFDELIHEYQRDSLIAAKEITAAIGAFDTHAWKKTASQLKGISDNLRLSQISDELAILSQTNDAQEANKASKRLNSFLEQL